MEGQDWDTLILYRKDSDKKKETPKVSSKVEISKKESLTLDSTEGGSHQKVSLSLAKQIQQGRTIQKMSQKELALKLCVQPKIVQDYESGKAIPEPNILNKISSTLKIKLTRR